MATVRYEGLDATVAARPTESILDVSLRNNIHHLHICGGNGRCSTCRVRVLNGLEHCSERNDTERDISEKMALASDVRLACQTRVSGDVTVRCLLMDRELSRRQGVPERATEQLGEEKHLCILFGDIAGFTPFAEKLLPYDVIHVLDQYYDRVAGVVARFGGTVNNYMGDGFLALFGLKDPANCVERGVEAGREILKSMRAFQAELRQHYQQEFDIRLGLHYGQVVIGEVGGEHEKRLTAIGDAVNMASRIEAANKALGTRFLISAAAHQRAAGAVAAGKQWTVDLPGKQGRHLVYEIDGPTS